MSSQLPEPERWVDRSARDASAESAVGAAFRRVKQATEPTDAAFEALRRRSAEARRRARPSGLVWRVAVASAVLLSAGGVVSAARAVWRWHATASHRDAQAAAPVERPARARTRRVIAQAKEAPALPEPPHAPVVAEAPVVAPSGAAPLRRPAREAAPPDEAELLADVFRRLRSDGDPQGALRALDEYDRRFSGGVLHDEARMARVEALMAEDRRQEALPLLAGIPEGDGALTRGVRVTRGELYAEAGRCAEASRDFERALVVADDDAVGGRALYGRASCRLRAGEVAAARADLERYLALHADGPFAPAARRALAAMP